MTCAHSNTDTTADGERVYCTDCGLRMVSPPGAVYYRSLEDSRRLKWRKVGQAGYVVELGVVYIGASWNPSSRTWAFHRVCWNEALGGFQMVQEGAPMPNAAPLTAYPLYIAHDELGTPCDMPVGVGGLPSQAA
jgi:hypothetical protein